MADSLRFGLIVCGQATHPGTATALAFARAVLDGGHELERVFFYHDGVTVAADQAAAVPWSQLAADHGISLVVCAAAAQRRGVDGLAQGFALGGLGQLVALSTCCNRIVSFGG